MLVQHTIDETWPIIEQEHLKASLQDWIAAMYAIITKFGSVASTLAVKYIRDTRPADLGSYTPVHGSLPSYDQVAKSLAWATKGFYSATPDTANVHNIVQGVGQKLVQDSAKATYLDNLRYDRYATAWARIARPDACSFCALLATRGAVYKSEQTAGFLAHDNCHCVALLIYKGDEPYVLPPYIQQWLDLYHESTRGLHNAAARNAFRRALGHG